jgi:small subunit ribosomal protein S20
MKFRFFYKDKTKNNKIKCYNKKVIITMANIKSNEKSKKQDDKKRLINKSLRSEIKTAIKKANVSKKEEDKNIAIKLIDKAVTSNVFHKNKAARLKSKIHLIK